MPPKKTSSENWARAHLLSYIRLKVLVRSYVYAHAPVLERSRRNFVCRAGHGRDHHVRERETALKVHFRRRSANHVMRVICATRTSTLPCPRPRSGAFIVFLYRIDVDGKDACTVVREERRERAAYHFRSFVLRRLFLVDIGREGWASRLPVDDGYGAAVGAVAVGQQRVVDTDALERFYHAQRRAWEDRLDGSCWRDGIVGWQGWCCCGERG